MMSPFHSSHRQLNHPNIIRIQDIICVNLDLDSPELTPYSKENATDSHTLTSLKRSRSGMLR